METEHLKNYPIINREISNNSYKTPSVSDQKNMKNKLDNILEAIQKHKEKIDKERSELERKQKQLSNLEKEKKKNEISDLEKEKRKLDLDLKKEATEKLEAEIIQKIVIDKANESVTYWWRFKYLIIFGSLGFLILLYLIFWYISDNFPIVEQSFTTLFCVI